ncbi:GntR family transcriptional regulator [Microbacterium capsulatum]|uniref:GntR family transcriptional regulator n=1 Tax=Microbacterium capsulatum TaxID=3041921 RepID=A0ABU0XIJ1_9MICO|nr:GntR family transcriptional regulator [Microbacterium sp. ASV81]MDQ4213500.1 GntR family transcriptional regulator [Microbacterium sp. ASV81]
MNARPLGMGEQIAHRLRVEILTGGVEDGTHLAEDALAARFDVSRGPVRDALRQLETEGLVENRRKRLYTRVLGLEGIEELYELREALESLAIRLAIARASAKDWDRVQEIVDRMRAAGELGDVEMFADADMQFHTAFYTLSRNRRLIEAWRPYQHTFEILFEMSDTPDIPAATADHQGFLEIIRTGDADAAVRRLHLHLTLAKGHIRDVLRKTADPSDAVAED